jgi:uncharacterized protein (TIGR02444 family)
MLQEHSLWQFSLDVYSHSEFQSLLLEAQDTAGVDVNFILAALWLAQNGMALAPERATSLWQTTEELREQGIVPVRALRRAWKHIDALKDARGTLQELELALEKQLQDELYQELTLNLQTKGECDQIAHIDLAERVRWNLSVLAVSDPETWRGMARKIETEYLAITGQI